MIRRLDTRIFQPSTCRINVVFLSHPIFAIDSRRLASCHLDNRHLDSHHLDMAFIETITNESAIPNEVWARPSFHINSIAYVILYSLAAFPNLMLIWLSCKRRLITGRIRYPIFALTLANVFGCVGYLSVNYMYLYSLYTKVSSSMI